MHTAVSICLTSRLPMVLWLGPELTMLYNDAWRPVLGATKHPHGLGRPGREVWPEIWDIIGTQMRSVIETGTATWSDDLRLTVDRYNYAEEAYFTYSYSPVQGENGDVCGVFSAVSETTLRVIGERRLKTLSELGALIKAKTSEEALTLSAEALRANDADVPFALIYLFSEDGATAELAKAIRVESGKACSPLSVDLSQEHLWPFAEIAKSQTTAAVDDLQRRFEKLPGGRWPAPPKCALVMPLQSLGKTELAGILIGGISPYRQLDDDYHRFYELVAGHIATSVANARAYQEAQKQAEMLAEIDRAKTVFFSNVSHEFRTPLTLMLGPLETHAAPLHNSDGTLVHLAITRDVTEQRRREQAALLLSAIVDSSDDAIISKDLNGVVTSWNKSAERLFGYSAAEAVGRSIAELLIPADRQEEEPKILDRLRRGERIDHFETVRRCKDGSLLEISLTISPVKDSAGRVIGASKIARDITDRKRTESAVQSLNAQLTADLSAVTRMQQLSTRLVQADDFPQLLGEIMDAGIEITNADMGNIQLLENGVLKIVSQRGFKEPFLDFFNQVHEGQAACGSALRNRERVIVQDVAQSAVFAGSHARDVMLAAGALAVQSTPLISRSGQLLGMFSTHFRSPHTPTERELRLLDVLARQAADLIERKRAEAALIASEVKFRQLAEVGPQIIWLSGPQGQLEFVNQRWVEFSGLDYEATKDPEQIAQRLHPDDHLLDHWGKSVASGTLFELEARLRGKDGEFRWFMMRSIPVRDEAGEIVRWVGTSTDIHQNMLLQLELKRANHDLEQFAYSASHDLQEPLRSIKIYGELLTGRHGSKLAGEAREFLEFLRAGASRMEILVRDLLAYTQVTKREAPSEPTEAAYVLATTLESLSQTIIESGASVTYDSLPAVRIDATHLRQLFQNLIGNAIKYRSPERAPAVHVSAERKNGSWAFSVRDNGIGIEPEYYRFIFGLFKRLHTEDEYSGTGLGLAICQRIVERYHGRIWVESELGQGSTFRFEIPSDGSGTMSWLEPLAEEVNR
jgi:PAS domain S-box-containing protein